jgi:hypothetical protein
MRLGETNVNLTLFKIKENQMTTNQESLEAEKQAKILEVQSQQDKLKTLQGDLDKLNAKIGRHEQLSPADTQFISNLGWLSALSVSVAALVAGL